MASVPPQGGRKHPHQEFLQIDTTNILFICGGALMAWTRLSNQEQAVSPSDLMQIFMKEEEQNVSELINRHCQILVSHGLIPEFAGSWLSVYP